MTGYRALNAMQQVGIPESSPGANREIKRPFSPTINLSLSPRVVNRNQSHQFLVKIAVLRGVFGPCIGPRWLISRQFGRLRECGPSGRVGPVAKPVKV